MSDETKGEGRGIPLDCVDLAAALDRHPTYVYAMKRAGYVFSHGNRTLLSHALSWLAKNPSFRSTRYRGTAKTRKRLQHLLLSAADIGGELVRSHD